VKTQMQVDIEGACESARTAAKRYSGYIANEDPVKTVLQFYDASIRYSIEHDDQIVEAYRHVVQCSQNLRNAQDIEAARKKVLEAIDELERVTLDRAEANDVAAITKWHKG
jgi:hypothetical protein